MDQKVEKILTEILDIFKLAISAALAFFKKLLVYIKETDWKGFSASFRELVSDFNGEHAKRFARQNKRALLIILIAFALVLVLLDSRPAYNTPGYSSPGSSTSGGYRPRESSECLVCKGTKTCVTCDGTGRYTLYGVSGECTACDGSGDCWKCDGTGLK